MRIRRRPKLVATLACAITALVCGAAISGAQSVVNDKYDQKKPVPMNTTAYSADSNNFAGIDPGEPLTSNGQSNNMRCDSNGNATADTGARMLATTWWSFIGTGEPVTVSDEKSDPAFDSVMGVYDAAKDPFSDATSFIACNDDIGAKGADATMTLSRVTIPTVAGHVYAVQVGSCETTTLSPAPCTVPKSKIAVTVTSPVASPDPSPTPGTSPTATPTPSPPGRRPKMGSKWSSLTVDPDPKRRTVRFLGFKINHLHANTKLVLRCHPARHCGFGASLRKMSLGPNSFSLTRWLAHRKGRVGWSTTLTFTLTNPGYRGRQYTLRINGLGKVRAIGPKNLS